MVEKIYEKDGKTYYGYAYRLMYVLENYKTKTVYEMAEDLGLSDTSVRDILKNNNLEGIDSRVKLTKDKLSFLDENYYKYPLSELSDRLGLTKQHIHYVIKSRGFDKAKDTRKYRVNYIREHYKKVSLNEMAKELFISVNTVQNIIAEEGVHKDWVLRRDNRIKEYITNSGGSKSSSAIARELGESQDLVRRLRKELENERIKG